jgi:hypothetical protein
MLIEQAVFASTPSMPTHNYQLVAKSMGVTAADARELAAWGPADGALCGQSEASTSVNFHPLPSGASCVGYSLAVGSGNSGRNGLRVYTQCLVVPPEDLARFANNPFAMLRAARSIGLLKIHDSASASLPPLQLPGHAAAVDEGLLGELVDRWGPRRLAWLVQAALAADALVLVGVDNADRLVAGLLNCLPVECRPELSFATGLEYSQRRPYRLNTVVADAAECRRIGRQMGVTLLNVNDEPPPDFEPTGWAGYLEATARADRLAGFALELNRSRAGLRISDLSWLARQLSERLQSSLAQLRGGSDAVGCDPVDAADTGPRPATPPEADFSFPGSPPSGYTSTGYGLADHGPTDHGPTNHEIGEPLQDPSSEYRHAHRAHPRMGGDAEHRRSQGGPALSSPGPSAVLAGSDSELLEKLEHLDDLVFDTIGGKQPAFDELTRLWPNLLAELPTEMLAESREQYLRYALSLWNSCHAEQVRDPQWAVAALDVLCVLFSADC